MTKDKRILNIARVAAAAGINVPVPAIKVILGSLDLVDKYEDDVTLKQVEDMVHSLELTVEDVSD